MKRAGNETDSHISPSPFPSLSLYEDYICFSYNLYEDYRLIFIEIDQMVNSFYFAHSVIICFFKKTYLHIQIFLLWSSNSFILRKTIKFLFSLIQMIESQHEIYMGTVPLIEELF